MWVWLSSRKRTIAVRVENEKVVEGPPSARWAIGKPLKELQRWIRNQGGYRGGVLKDDNDG